MHRPASKGETTFPAEERKVEEARVLESVRPHGIRAGPTRRASDREHRRRRRSIKDAMDQNREWWMRWRTTFVYLRVGSSLIGP